MKNKALALIVCIAMMMSLFTIGAYADNEIDWENYVPADGCEVGDVTETIIWDYNATTRVLTLSGIGAMPDFDGYDVQPWGTIRAKAEKVIVGEGITYIGDSNFARFSSVEEFDFPSTVKEMANTYSQTAECL